MKVLGTNVLVLVESQKTNRLVIDQPRKGVVVATGPKVEGLGKNDSVIFGDQYDKLTLAISGEPKEYFLMDKTNIKIAFENGSLDQLSSISQGYGRND